MGLNRQKNIALSPAALGPWPWLLPEFPPRPMWRGAAPGTLEALFCSFWRAPLSLLSEALSLRSEACIQGSIQGSSGGGGARPSLPCLGMTHWPLGRGDDVSLAWPGLTTILAAAARGQCPAPLPLANARRRGGGQHAAQPLHGGPRRSSGVRRSERGRGGYEHPAVCTLTPLAPLAPATREDRIA